MSAESHDRSTRPFPTRDWLELLGGPESRFVRAVIRAHCGHVTPEQLAASLRDAISFDGTAWDLAGVEVWSFKLYIKGCPRSFRVSLSYAESRPLSMAWEAWCSLVPYKGDAEASPGEAIEDLVATMIHRGDWRGPATA